MTASDEAWIALAPTTLDGAEKRALQKIGELGSYFGTGSLDIDVLDALEERAFISAHRSEHYGTLVYRLTERGLLWLKGCRPVEPVETAADHPQS